LQNTGNGSYNTEYCFFQEDSMSTTLRSLALIALSLCLALFLCGCAHYAAQSDFDKGIAYFNQGNYAAAVPYFQSATISDPEYADAYIYLGRTYLNLRQWDKAVAPLRTAYRLAPDMTKGMIQDLIMDAIISAAAEGIKLEK
jgi:tetratricopeptide (TPR) repeat protein